MKCKYCPAEIPGCRNAEYAAGCVNFHRPQLKVNMTNRACHYCQKVGVDHCTTLFEAEGCPYPYKWLDTNPKNQLPSEDQYTIGSWAMETFPNRDTKVAARRMFAEVVELLDLFWDPAIMASRNPTTTEIARECADVFVTLCNVATMAGIDLQTAVNEKMKTNRARKWKINPDGSGQHIA